MSTHPNDLFSPLDSVDVPDQWSAIEGRLSPQQDPPSSPRRLRMFALAAATFFGTFALVVVLVTAFRTAEPPAGHGAPSPSEVANVRLGPPTQLQVAPRGQLYAMVESSGSLWVLGAFDPESGETSLRRLDPADGSIQARFQLPLATQSEWGGDGLLVGGGYVWGTGWKGATIYRVDPTDSSVSIFELDGRYVSDLAYDSDEGKLWAVLGRRVGEDPALVEVDPTDGTVLSSTPFQLEWSSGLLTAGDAVWILGREVSNAGGVRDGFLRQLAPGTAEEVSTGGSFALPVTDGRWIWTTVMGDEAAMNLARGIAQVDPVDGSVVNSWDAGGVGYDIAVGPDRGVWFLGNKGLERLNPSTAKTQVWEQDRETTPIFIVPTEDGVWIGAYAGTLDFRPFRTASQVVDVDVSDYDSFMDAMSSVLVARERGGKGLQRIIGVPGHRFYAGGAMYVHEFPTPSALEAFSDGVSSDGSQIPTRDGNGRIFVEWASPRLYGEGRVLVVYFGESEATLKALKSIVGPPFAPRHDP